MGDTGVNTTRSYEESWRRSRRRPYQTMDEIPVIPPVIEDVFIVSIDNFTMSMDNFTMSIHSHATANSDGFTATQDSPVTDAYTANTRRNRVREFVMRTVLRLRGVSFYVVMPIISFDLLILFRISSSYSSRFDRIFSGVKLSLPEIVKIATEMTIAGEDTHFVRSESLENGPQEVEATVVHQKLQTRWIDLINNIIKEWETINLISVLLLGAIMTMFQIDGAAQDPVTRYLAFCSLTFSLLSLLHGHMLVVRFSTMRRMSRAAEWALEVQKDPNPFWNVWAMLSTPLFELIWAIITFIICIMTFMWRSRAQLPDDFVFSVAQNTELGARIFVSCVLGIGMIRTCLIFHTLVKYGSKMDDKWEERIRQFVKVYNLKAKKSRWELDPRPKEKNTGEGKPNDHQKAPTDNCSEGRKREVGESDQAETSNGQQPQGFRPAAKAQSEEQRAL